MTALIVIVWTLAGIVVGVFGIGFIGELAGIRAMEGRLAMFAISFGAPTGALTGLLLGLALAKRYAERLRALRLLLVTPIAVLLAIALGVYLFETWRSYDHLTTRPNTWDLGFQVRLPAGQPTPAGQKVGVEIRSPKENPSCKTYDYPHGLRQEGEHFVLSGGCPLFYATPQRTILVRIGDKPTLIFNLRVKARPEAATYSDWFPVDEIYDNATGQKRAPRPDEQYAIRLGPAEEALPAGLAETPRAPLKGLCKRARVNTKFTVVRDANGLFFEGFRHVRAGLCTRDETGGAGRPVRCCPHSRRSSAPEAPLRAGWASLPGRSGVTRRKP